MSIIRNTIENQRTTTPTKVGDATLADEAVSKAQITGATPLAGLNADLVRGLPADFTSSKAANGYQKLPSGVILQWGTTTASSAISGTSTTVTLPISFIIACVTTLATNTGPVIGNSTYNTTSKTASNFTVQRGNNSNIETGKSFNWVAIGY